jgi:hypothetical protein
MTRARSATSSLLWPCRVEHARESQAHSLNAFFTFSLCHAVLTNVDPETGTVTYKTQSPDGEALFMPLLQLDVSSVVVTAMSFTTSSSDELEHY